MTLTEFLEFLLARIAEDEAVAREAHYDGQRWYPEEEFVGRWPECCDCGCPVMFGANRKVEAEHIARYDPARVLAECEAKRRLIDLAFEHASTIDGEWGCCHDAETIRTGVVKADGPWEEDEPLPGRCTGPAAAMPYLAALALPYADHPDYREEWKP